MRVVRAALDVDGRSVSYRTGGAGSRVLVLGPIAGSTALCATLVDALAADHEVVAVDPPGYGLSDPLPPGDLTVADLADSAAGALAALGAGATALVGQGTGALAAIELARRAPELFPLLVLDDVPAAQERAEPPCASIEPELDGSHLLRHWYRRRTELLRDPTGGRLDLDLTTAEAVDVQLHRAVLDQLQAVDPGRPYRAAAAYDAVAALAEVTVPVVRAGADRAVVEALQGWRPAPAARFTPERDRGRWTVEFPVTPRGQLAARRFRPYETSSRPLVVLHASPLSSEAMLAFAEPFTGDREVVLLDTLGNGDSDQPGPGEALTAADFGATVLAAVAALGVTRFDLYGTHTGALLALEAALAAPDRVAGLVLDGVPLYTPQEAADVWPGYLIDLTPRWDGTHLVAAWSTMTDVLTWYPWHRRDPAHRRDLPPPTAQALHRRFVQMAKGGVGYRASHLAVEQHPTRERLPLLEVPTAFCAHSADPLAGTLRESRALLPSADVLELGGGAEQDAGRIARWLSRRTRIHQTY